MSLSDASKMFNVYGWVVETTGSDRCRSSKGREVFSIALLIIPDAVIMESNFLAHLLHKYPILDSSSTVGELEQVERVNCRIIISRNTYHCLLS